MGGKKVWTILQILEETTRFFEKEGISNPRLDAEVILAHALHTNRVGLYINFDRPLNDKEVSAYRRLVIRRARREPLHYVIGCREFWSLNFKVGPGVLIPRQETETLIEVALKTLTDREGALNLLDIGTGCGVIAVILAREFKRASLWAVDSSETALHFARKNAMTHGVLDRITFLRGRCLEPFKCGEQAFDAIFANPPYIKAGDIPHLQPEVRDYEPHEALDGGEDGLGIIKRITSQAHLYLKKGGWLFMEVGEGQTAFVCDIIRHTGRYTSIDVAKDMSGIDRVVKARTV